jgi:hypothetical protein
MTPIIGSHIDAYRTKRERSNKRNGDNTIASHGHGIGPHSNGKQAPANCPVCKRPMLECLGDCISDDHLAQLDYQSRCASGRFTLDSRGRPIIGHKRGRKKAER